MALLKPSGCPFPQDAPLDSLFQCPECLKVYLLKADPWNPMPRLYWKKISNRRARRILRKAGVHLGGSFDAFNQDSPENFNL